MATSGTPTVDALLATLKQELEDTPADTFERLAADLFCRLLGDIGVSVSKPGSQFGGDAGTAGLRRRHLRLECKRYKESTPLAPRALGGEVLEAVLKDPQLEAWVLASTKTVSETERNVARDGGAELGVPIVVIDWTEQPPGVGINAIAALCAKWPDIVEKHIGKAAGGAASALAAHAGSTAENLRKDLETWNIGFNHLRVKSHKHLKKVWTDSAQSLATLNQDAAGGRPGVSLIERKDVLQALEAWWLSPGDVRSPAVVIGQEGVGKTWVSLDWLSRSAASLPIVVPVPASTFLSHQDYSEAGVRDLLAQSLRWLAGSHQGIEYWRTRVDRILERPVAEGVAVLLLVDGINQRPTVGWEALGQTSLAGKVRILFTTRRHYFETSLRQFAGLNFQATQVPVGAYSPAELDELLRLNGMDKSEVPAGLLNLASTPRLFPLIVRLKNSDALRADATVLRLMFEYGKDVHQVRTNSSLTDEAWVLWLGARALDYRDRLVRTGSGTSTSTIKDVASSLADPKASPAAWEDFLAGAEAQSATFLRRVHSAEGLYLCLCDVLLAHAPAKGLRLWRALADSMKVRFNGLAKIPELVHIAMRAPDSAEVDAVRAELTNLIRCNCDQDLFEVVIASQLHDRDNWLKDFIDADVASNQPWRQKRAAVLKAFHQLPAIGKLQWPEGKTVGSLRALERNLLKWTNRGALAKYWWERFIGATDADTAFAAWHVFLGSADRRAWLWWSRRPEPKTELDRLRELHLGSNKDLFARALEKPEEKAPKFAGHLFGRDAPRKWLMLDGVPAR